METVLIIGATGNIGVSAVIAALRTGRHVLAVVRNQQSAEKMFQHVGTREGITTVEADVVSEDGVTGVVEQVKAGKLPDFQHVYSAVGIVDNSFPFHEVDIERIKRSVDVNIWANLYAYRATIPHLLSQAHPHSTYTLCTGSSGDLGIIAVTGITQGALYSLINAAILENANTNIRVNEVYLKYRVDYDSVAEKREVGHAIKASEFAKVYEGILGRREIDGARVTVEGPGDVGVLRWEGKARHQLRNEDVAALVL